MSCQHPYNFRLAVAVAGIVGPAQRSVKVQSTIGDVLALPVLTGIDMAIASCSKRPANPL